MDPTGKSWLMLVQNFDCLLPVSVAGSKKRGEIERGGCVGLEVIVPTRCPWWWCCCLLPTSEREVKSDKTGGMGMDGE